MRGGRVVIEDRGRVSLGGWRRSKVERIGEGLARARWLSLTLAQSRKGEVGTIRAERLTKAWKSIVVKAANQLMRLNWL
jgi:hypothetical protein